MNARTYYLVRIGTYAAVLIALIVIAARKPGTLDQTSVIGLSIVAAVLALLIAQAVWRLRSLAPGTQLRGFGPPPEVVRAHAQAGSRQMPLTALLVGGVGLVGSYYYMIWKHRGYPALVVVMPVLFLLGLAGMIHPPIFYAMRKDAGPQPGGARAIAYFLSAIGLAIGGFCAWWFFWR